MAEGPPPKLSHTGDRLMAKELLEDVWFKVD